MMENYIVYCININKNRGKGIWQRRLTLRYWKKNVTKEFSYNLSQNSQDWATLRPPKWCGWLFVSTGHLILLFKVLPPWIRENFLQLYNGTNKYLHFFLMEHRRVRKRNFNNLYNLWQPFSPDDFTSSMQKRAREFICHRPCSLCPGCSIHPSVRPGCFRCIIEIFQGNFAISMQFFTCLRNISDIYTEWEVGCLKMWWVLKMLAVVFTLRTSLKASLVLFSSLNRFAP